MKKEELKLGDKVKAIFRKYGKHIVIGEVWEISTDEHALDGTWVSIKVTGGDMSDKHVSWMVANKINVMVPISDVKEVIR
ncbi:MAG: hypothetical protein J6N95_05380 [Bacilli bacterium]|nr:hypothetical protein [Bacilli bacterium]MBO6280613.1 hypothetical protein [Bacilli bacterium]